MPLISVIIPTCHRNDLLAKCLDCLAPGVQTLPPEQYEVIVTDDGSRTTAQQLVQESYPWVQWTEGPRRGPAANRNHGATIARGEWLAFTDDDCLPKPEWLEAYWTSIQPNIFVYEGKTTCEAGLHSPLQDAPINLTGGWLWSCNMMAKKEIFELLHGFDEDFPHPHMEDVDFRDRLKSDHLDFVFVECAVVDHPPRRVAWGPERGAAQESEIMSYFKSGRSRLAGLRILKRTVGFRLRAIKNNRFSADTIRALGSLFCELFYLSTKVRGWEAKYKAAYLSSKSD